MNLDMKLRTLTLLEKNRRIFSWPWVDKGFTEQDAKKHKSYKVNFEKLDFIKVKIFEIQKTELGKCRQTTEWEKTFTNHISDNQLLSRIYKEILHVIIER